MRTEKIIELLGHSGKVMLRPGVPAPAQLSVGFCIVLAIGREVKINFLL